MKPVFTVGYLPILDHLTLAVSQKNDGLYFQHFILKARLFEDWESLSQALIRKKINGAFILAPLAMKLFLDGVDIRAVLLGHREGQVMVVKKNINNTRELKGKTVFVPHLYSTHLLLLSQILQSAGLTVRDVKLKIGSRDIRTVGDGLAKGDIDAFIVAEPMGTEASRRQVGKIAVLSHDIKTHHIDCILALQENLIRRYPAACQEFINSLVKAGMFINAYPRQAAKIGENFLGHPNNVLLEALTHDKGHILYWDLLPRVEDFEDLQRMAVVEMNFWDRPVDLTKFVYQDFAQAAYRDWTIDTRRKTKDKGEERTLPGNFLESTTRLQSFFKEHIPVTGIKFIKTGEKFPVGIKRIKQEGNTNSELLEEALSGKEVITNDPFCGNKGACFFQPTRDFVPDRIIMMLTKDQAERCGRALRFGAGDLQIKNMTSEYIDQEFFKEKGAVAIKKDKKFWCSLEYNQFRFLALLLFYYF